MRFRFWNTETRCMYEDTGLTSLGVNDGLELAVKNNYIPMLYSEIPDNKGTEICVGDILCEVASDGYKYYDEVYFEEGTFKTRGVLNGGIGILSQNKEHIQAKCTIVGNIYQHPGLIPLKHIMQGEAE